MNKMYNIYIKTYCYLYYFVFYSFLGWCFETFIIFILDGQIVERGFIYGPFCIIYGFGIIMLLKLLDPIKDRTYLYFFFSTLLVTALEYVTGFSLEKIYHKRWWDYSHLAFNLNGYICLSSSLVWGSLAIVIIRYIHPRTQKIFSKIPQKISFRISFIILFLTLADISLSIINSR